MISDIALQSASASWRMRNKNVATKYQQAFFMNSGQKEYRNVAPKVLGSPKTPA
jgi:hypothetical protein